MSWNEPSYRRFEQHHEEIAFSTFSKQPQPIIAQAEQSWIPQSQAHPTHRSRSLWTLVNEWRWEFLTWLLGVCALGSIAALLVIYGDRPLREWTPHIRPAPVVAALSQLAQSALLFSVSSCIGQLKWDWLHRTRSASDLKVFEEASRGPKGSLMLLPKTRLHLVSIGALATILLLIFSPSMQLSNSIKLRNVNSTNTYPNVTVSRSVQYMNFVWNTSLIDRDSRGRFNSTQPGILNIHPHMSKAIVSGVIDNQKSISDITGNCQAEACRWEDYTTLAICTSIEDVSSQGEIRNNTKKIPGFRLQGTSWVPPSQALLDVRDTFWMAAPFKDSSTIKNEELASIADIYVAHYPPCNEQKQSRGADWSKQFNDASNWKAYKGTLSLCLQTLSSTYNNTMNTTVIETQKELRWKSFDKNKDNGTVCLTKPYKGDNFCVGQGDLMQWSTSLARTLEGAASMQEDYDNYYTGQWVPNIVGDIMGPNPVACDPNLGPGYGLEGFTRRVNAIAIAMSNAMRTGNTTSPDSIVLGSAWASEQYIAVDFKWLLPPAAICLAITVFLFATIIKSRRANVPLWKSSPLVLLHSMERNNGMQTLKQIEKGAEETRVQLQYSGENWYLQDVTRQQT